MAAVQGMPGHPPSLSLGQSSRIAPSGWTATASAGTVHERLHDFVKCALLQQLVPPGATVCDLYCGRGMDTEKWARAQIGRYVGVDFAASALEAAREQWDNHNRPYPADFCEVDPCMADLQSQLRHMGLPADFVCCMGHLQDCFFSEDVVRRLLHNVASLLKPGGYFFGTTADSSTIWSKYQKAVEGAHKAGSLRANGALPRVNSEQYVISFEDDRFTSFGTKYTLQFADGLISQSQLLVHFPSLIRLAEEVGLEYVEIQNLQEFYDDYRSQFFDTLRATCANLLDSKGRLHLYANDVLSLYTTFIFKKADHSEPGFTLSPSLLADEDHLEALPEEAEVANVAMHLNIAPNQDHHISPDELRESGRKCLVQSIIRNEGDITDTWGPEEDHGSVQELSTMQSPFSWNMKGDSEKHVCSHGDHPLDGRQLNSKQPKEQEEGMKPDDSRLIIKSSEEKQLEAEFQTFNSSNGCKKKHSLHLANSLSQLDAGCNEEAAAHSKGTAEESQVDLGKLRKMEKESPERCPANKRFDVESGGLNEFSDKAKQQGLDCAGEDEKWQSSEGVTLCSASEVLKEQDLSVNGDDKMLGIVANSSWCKKQHEENALPCSSYGEVKHGVDGLVNTCSSQICTDEGHDMMKQPHAVELLKQEDPAIVEDLKSPKSGHSMEGVTDEQNCCAKQKIEIPCKEEDLVSICHSPCSGRQQAMVAGHELCSYVERVAPPSPNSISFEEGQIVLNNEQQMDIGFGGEVLGGRRRDLTTTKEEHAEGEMHLPKASEKASLRNSAVTEKVTKVEHHMVKGSTRRMHIPSKEDSQGGRGKHSSVEGSQAEATSGHQRYRSTQSSSKSHHHSTYVEERQDQSHGSRYSTLAPHASYHSRTSREQAGEGRNRHVSSSRRGEDLRDWSRGAYNAPSRVHFFHLSSQQDVKAYYPLPIQSPNTRGILGPGPSSLAISEPIREFNSWQLSQPLERKIPKGRTSRNLPRDREGAGSRGWRDSPPPGTES